MPLISSCFRLPDNLASSNQLPTFPKTREFDVRIQLYSLSFTNLGPTTQKKTNQARQVQTA